MTNKDFKLIEDAINEGVKNFMDHPVIKEIDGAKAAAIHRNIRVEIGKAFLSRLPYTCDFFDAAKFKNAIE